MADSINLLPSKRRSAVHLKGLLKRVGFFGLLISLVFFVVSLALIIGILINENKISSLNKRNARLQEEIKAFSETEQKYYLIKDRAKKIDSTLHNYRSRDRLNDLDSFLSDVGFLGLRGLEVNNNVLSFKVNTKNYNDVVKLISSIKENSVYKQVVLDSLVFSPVDGFNISISLKI